MPTPIRALRIPDDLWAAALRISRERGESITAVVVRALERYVKRHTSPPPTSSRVQ